MNTITVFTYFTTTILFFIYSTQGKPAEIYHHYIPRGDCDHQDETDINLSRMVVRQYDVEEPEFFNVTDCLKCSIDQDFERGVHGGYISCKCVQNTGDLVHGDIKIDDRNREYMNGAFGRPTFRRGTISGDRYKWPKDARNNVIIPYQLEGAFLQAGGDISLRFKSAIKAFHDRTCVRFVPRTNQKDYIAPVNQKGCWAFIGKVGGRQEVSIGASCGKVGIVMHELMHCLGFFHEQSRKDRDRYVTIHMQNVMSGFDNNFEIATDIESTTSPYDYESVMHYGSYSFTTSHTRQTITRNDGGDTSRMGQRDAPTDIDYEEINARYCGGSISGTKPSVAATTTRPTWTTARTTTTAAPQTTGCKNKYSESNCDYWKKLGYCGHTYKDFMQQYCEKACGLCQPTDGNNGIIPQSTCEDRVKGCDSFSTFCHGLHVSWMRAYCSKTCAFCASSEIYTTKAPKTTAAPRKINNAVCGTVYTNSLYARIVGGEDADVGSIPWQANIRFKELSVCGGTYIGERWILTAAHCMVGRPEDYTVLLGLQDRDNIDEPQVQTFGVVTITRHENYRPMTSSGAMINDIALIQLDSDVTSTNYVVPACLPNKGWAADNFNPLIASGWGDTTEAGSHSQTLQKVSLSLISKAKCVEWLGESGFQIDDNAICAGDVQGGKDSCQGDSGGPLTATVGSTRQYLIAVVSWGVGCGREKHPGIYTKVAPFRDWIEENTGL